MEQVGLAEGLAEQVTEWDRLASIEVSRCDLGKPVLVTPRKGFCEFTHRRSGGRGFQQAFVRPLNAEREVESQPLALIFVGGRPVRGPRLRNVICYQRGYTAIDVAMLFLFYEVFGIVTNLVGGWMAARLGLKATLFVGLGTQVVALSMLALVEPVWLAVPYVMVAQALSGIARRRRPDPRRIIAGRQRSLRGRAGGR